MTVPVCVMKIEHGHCYPKNITYLIDGLMPVQAKNDCVNHCKQSYWSKVGHEHIKALLAKDCNDTTPSDDACNQGCTKENYSAPAAAHLPESSMQSRL